MSIIKNLHVLFALVSITGFVYRSFLKLRAPQKLKQKWLRIAPHIIDTMLLLSAIYLVIATQQYPEVTNWLSAKIVALFFYIIFGMFTLRFSKSPHAVLLSFILALTTFAYIVSVAMTKQVLPLML